MELQKFVIIKTIFILLPDRVMSNNRIDELILLTAPKSNAKFNNTKSLKVYKYNKLEIG